MDQPKAPRLEDFQLAPDSLARIPKRHFRAGAVVVGKPIIFLGGAIVASYLTNGQWPWIVAQFVGWYLFVGLPCFGIASAILLFPLLNLLEIQFLRRRSPDFDKALCFDNAMGAYQQAEARYNKWVCERKEEYWRNLSGVDFENAMADVFKRMGFSVKFGVDPFWWTPQC